MVLSQLLKILHLENISISRPLFFYIKNAHVGVIPGMLEYVEEFLSDAASGEDGYLGEKGLISMPDSERAKLNPKVLDLSLIVGDISPSKLKINKSFNCYVLRGE